MPLYKVSITGCFSRVMEYSRNVNVIPAVMPTPEIHYSVAFGMGFWIAEDGTLMSCPAFENGGFDLDGAIAVDEWDDPSVYTPDHLILLAQIVQICTLKRDYVNIGYYAERFRTVA